MNSTNNHKPLFGCAAWGWRELSVPEYFENAKKIGFTNLEVNAHAQTPKHLLNDCSEESLEKIISWADTANINIACLAADSDFTVTNSSELETEIKKVCRFVDMAEKLQTKLVRIFTGGEKEDYLSPELLKQLHYAFNCIGDYAEPRNIEIAIENHGGITATGQKMAKIMEGIKSPAIGVNYDPANFLMAGTDPLMALRYIQPWVKYTHWKDVRWADGHPELCAVGEGEIHWEEIVKQLLDQNYQGYWTIEYETTEDVQRGTVESLNHLKQIFQKISFN